MYCRCERGLRSRGDVTSCKHRVVHCNELMRQADMAGDSDCETSSMDSAKVCTVRSRPTCRSHDKHFKEATCSVNARECGRHCSTQLFTFSRLSV